MSKARFFILIVILILSSMYYLSLSPSTKTISIIIKSATLVYKVILMDDRQPFYKLATLGGTKPYADGDRAQGTVVKHLQLTKRCHNDPTLIVVDIGAFLGDFGLYAAACGCPVYLFEVQPNMVDLIKTSVLINNFSSSRVHVINKAVSTLPTNSELKFAVAGGDTTAVNGTLAVRTIRLDDMEWPANSKILLLKIDVEGFELDVLRSAQQLFRDQRIHHLIFEFTPYWTERGAQRELLPFVQKTLKPKKLYALHRTEYDVFGPITEDMFDRFYHNHSTRRLQTDIYATFVDTDGLIEAKPYDFITSFA